MKAEWFFRKLSRGEKVRDPTQGEFFATDAIKNPSEALVREAIQNSLDAALENNVLVRIGLYRTSPLQPRAAEPWFTGIWPHLRAKGNGLLDPPEPEEPCPFLVIEDFGTIGLTGDPDQEFDQGNDNHFYGRRAEPPSGGTVRANAAWANTFSRGPGERTCSSR